MYTSSPFFSSSCRCSISSPFPLFLSLVHLFFSPLIIFVTFLLSSNFSSSSFWCRFIGVASITTPSLILLVFLLLHLLFLNPFLALFQSSYCFFCFYFSTTPPPLPPLQYIVSPLHSDVTKEVRG